jgi:predicted glycogen debranching enzyme
VTIAIDDGTEWLEADGLGGFASGTTSGVRTRRYHALLLSATTPPTGRVVLINSVDVSIETSTGTFALSSQRYGPGVIHPDGNRRIVNFHNEPWPTWEFETSDGTRIRHEIMVPHGTPSTLLTWTVVHSAGPVILRMRPFFSGRDYHATHHENSAFGFAPSVTARIDRDARHDTVTFAPYQGIPHVELRTNGRYHHAPDWYRNFLYVAERERGLDDAEDLAAPGEFEWRLAGQDAEAVCLLQAIIGSSSNQLDDQVPLARTVTGLRRAERERRARFATPLERAADAFLVRRRSGRTIIAGYPWFTDWGRDTFIALRGLCLATGRLDAARDILIAWAGAVSDGMLPNRFPDHGEAAEFNSVDASLWYVIAVQELLERTRAEPGLLSSASEQSLLRATSEIVNGYARGTRFGITLDDDGLLRAGVPGVQLTWMDARVGDRVITPRIGKPVEIQALWLNAVAIVAQQDARWRAVFEHGRASFVARFWRDADGYLADVIDVDHVRGTRDNRFRPNQIFAVGGLPQPLIDGPNARRIVDAVEQRLLTPFGLRSLAPGEPEYRGRYEGPAADRDARYHQGIVWPWLIGPFVDAWLRTRSRTATTSSEARERFLNPLLTHLDTAGLGHVSEIADGDVPFTPRGCPFQAWSLGELIRIERKLRTAELA